MFFGVGQEDGNVSKSIAKDAIEFSQPEACQLNYRDENLLTVFRMKASSPHKIFEGLFQCLTLPPKPILS